MDQNTVNAVVAGAAILSALAAMISAGVAAWSAHLQREAGKPHLRVELSIKSTIGIRGFPDATILAIDIANRGAFPVTVNGIGFKLRDGRSAPIISPILIDRRAFPARLDPGDAITVANDIREIAVMHVSKGGIAHAYAGTMAGDRFVSEAPGAWLTSWAKT